MTDGPRSRVIDALADAAAREIATNRTATTNFWLDEVIDLHAPGLIHANAGDAQTIGG
jgi:hypothetical protein